MNSLLQKSPPVAALLELFALERKYVGPGMHRLSDRNELPLVLQRIARRYEKAQCAWCGWADERRMCFVTARKVSVPLSKIEGPIIRIGFYDKDGRLMSAAAWAQESGRAWKLVAVGATRSADKARARVQFGTKQVISATHPLQGEAHMVPSCS